MSKIKMGTNCMDCLDGLKLLKNNSIDLVITSPPYDNLKTYNGYCFDFESIAKELFRVLKPNGTVLIQTPFKDGEIYEDYAITSESERLIHFGQEDHVRIYSCSSVSTGSRSDRNFQGSDPKYRVPS